MNEKSKTTAAAMPAGTAADPTNKNTPPPAKFVPKILKRLTYPTLKLEAGVPVYVKFLEEIVTKPKLDKNEKGEVVEKNIRIARVVNLENQTECEFVVGDVLDKELVAAGKLTGKAFMFTKKNVDGKRYKTYDIAEIEA